MKRQDQFLLLRGEDDRVAEVDGVNEHLAGPGVDRELAQRRKWFSDEHSEALG